MKNGAAPFSSPLIAAADALEDVESTLQGLPMTREVRDLHTRWSALRTVLHGVAVQGMPRLTERQRSDLLVRVMQLAADVTATRRGLGK